MIRFLQKSGYVQKAIFGTVIFLASVAMVWYLIPGGTFDTMAGNVSPGVVAKVGDNEITVNEVDTVARNMGRQQFQQGVPDQLLPFLRQRAAQSLIYQKALVYEASRMGMKVTDQEMADMLRNSQLKDVLFPNGQFVGSQAYEDFVYSRFNVSVPQFEQSVKNDMLVDKLQAALTGAVSVSPQDVQKEYEKEKLKVKLQYAVLSADELAKTIKPTEAELKAFYEQNKASYVNAIPEKRKVQYALLDLDKIKNQVQVTPDDLQAYYRAHQDEFRVPERVNVRHILIKTPPPTPDGKVDQKAVDAARAKAEGILKQLQSGADFATLAKKDSEDPGSAQNGGSLGWITKGRTVPEFEQAAFSLKPGELSGLVKSVFGFHIIKVDAHEQAHLRTLDEVKSEIEPRVKDEKAAKQVDQLVNQMQGQAHSLGLEGAASKHGLNVVTTDYFARTDSLPGLGPSPDFMQAVFSTPAKQAPSVVRVQQGFALFQVLDIKPPQTPSFQEIKDRVTEDFRRQRVGAMLAQKTQELSDRARSLHDLAKAAKEVGATVKTSDLVGPNSQVPDLGSMSGPGEVAFSLKPGEISAPIQAGSNGVVLTVTERHEPSLDELQKSQDQLREKLVQQKRQQMLELFASTLVDRLEKQGKIRKNKQEWERLTNAKGQGEPGS